MTSSGTVSGVGTFPSSSPGHLSLLLRSKPSPPFGVPTQALPAVGSHSVRRPARLCDTERRGGLCNASRFRPAGLWCPRGLLRGQAAVTMQGPSSLVPSGFSTVPSVVSREPSPHLVLWRGGGREGSRGLFSNDCFYLKFVPSVTLLYLTSQHTSQLLTIMWDLNSLNYSLGSLSFRVNQVTLSETYYFHTFLHSQP